MGLKEEILRRRTFGIVSHPDAGKTTLTEKLLLFGGAIHVAGAVKSNKIKKGAIPEDRFKQSLLRILTLKQKFLKSFFPEPEKKIKEYFLMDW